MVTIAAPSLDSFPTLGEASIEQLQHGLSRGVFTSVDLVRAYFARIDQVDHLVRAIISTRADALSVASAMDAERREGKVRGPLHGIPILLKDNMAMASSDPNVPSATAGSFALAHATTDRDAALVTLLKNAGAVILAKANMNEWSGFRIRPMPLNDGWSAVRGQCYGAHVPNQTPQGSSGGSAVAVDLGLCPVALGTDTGGSITMPAAFNNVVGIRPTSGLVSRDLVVPISLRRDSVGVLARTVQDAALVLGIIVGRGPGSDDHAGDVVPADIPKYTGPAFPRNYLSACNAGALSGARIGVPFVVIQRMCQRLPHFSPQVSVFHSMLSVLEDAGAVLVSTHFTASEARPDDNEDPDLLDLYMKELATAAWDDIPAYLARLKTNPEGIHTFSDLKEWTARQGAREGLPERNMAWWELVDYGKSDPRAAELRRINDEFSGPGALLGAIRRDSLDAVVMPTQFGFGWTARIGAVGVTVPLGSYGVEVGDVKNPKGLENYVAPGMPFGMLFMGDHWSEERIIGLAYDFEQRTKARASGKLIINPTIEIRDVVR